MAYTDRPYLGPRKPRPISHYIRRNKAKQAKRQSNKQTNN